MVASVFPLKIDVFPLCAFLRAAETGNVKATPTTVRHRGGIGPSVNPIVVSKYD